MKITIWGVSILFLLTVCGGNVIAGEVNADHGRPMSIVELNKQLAAPQFYSVIAYVVEKYDKCPPCPPNAVCETCQLGIFISDSNTPLESGNPRMDGLYLRTRQAGGFRVGARYLFTLRYWIEKNQAGAWLRSGPMLVDHELVQSGKDRQ